MNIFVGSRESSSGMSPEALASWRKNCLPSEFSTHEPRVQLMDRGGLRQEEDHRKIWWRWGERLENLRALQLLGLKSPSTGHFLPI